MTASVDQGSVVLAPAVAWVVRESEGELTAFVAPVPDGPPLVLRGTSCHIWVAAVDPPTPREVREVAARVAEDYDVPVSDVADDVAAFLAELVARSLLRRV